MGDPVSSLDLSAVPLFPLPNVVLFPRAVLPLHIFEERYKAMTADVLAGDRQIAMALLRPGWEKNYYSRPEIEPVVCVGQIVSHEKLSDGKYNFLLNGLMRARIVRELASGTPYRVAELQPLSEQNDLEIDLAQQRQELLTLFNDAALGSISLAAQFRKLLEMPWATSNIADLIAFNCFDDPWLKQRLLAEEDVRQRVSQIIRELEKMRRRIPPPSGHLRPPNLN